MSDWNRKIVNNERREYGGKSMCREVIKVNITNKKGKKKGSQIGACGIVKL